MAQDPINLSEPGRMAQGLLCPHCRVDLVMSERLGVEIDYCPKCRGVWLDRGELDKIIERTEADLSRQTASQSPAAPPPQQQPYPAQPYPAQPYPAQPSGHHEERRHHGSGHHGSSRHGFFGRLFD